MRSSIDVVIPSYRVEEKYILPLFQLNRPENADVNFFLVVDNPEAKIPDPVVEWALEGKIKLLVNESNQGVAQTRNRGLDAGVGKWVLFLDDDIVADKDLLITYSKAIQQFPEELGFIGLVQFPEATNAFCKAILVSGSMDIFSVSKRKSHFAWGATANVLLRREAIGNIRFSELFPKKGGGEDVDFFLCVRSANQYQEFKTLETARVFHPWWYNHKPDFKRPFRYGRGNSLLGIRHKENTYYDLLNTPETVLILLLLILVLLVINPAFTIPAFWFLGGILIVELIANIFQVYKRSRMLGIRISWYVTLLRLSHDTGVLWGKLAKGQILRMGERFHDDGKIRKLYFYRFNSYKIIKWVGYLALASWLVMKYF